MCVFYDILPSVYHFNADDFELCFEIWITLYF